MKAKKTINPITNTIAEQTLHTNSGWGFVLFFMPIRKSRKTVCLKGNTSMRCVKTKKTVNLYIHTSNKAHNVAAIFHSAFFSLTILKLVHTPQTSTLYRYEGTEKNVGPTFSPIVCIFSVSWLFLFYIRNVTQRNST